MADESSIPNDADETEPSSDANASAAKVPLFGARKLARAQAQRIADLEANGLTLANRLETCASEVTDLTTRLTEANSALDRLGALGLVELERQENELRKQIQRERADAAALAAKAKADLESAIALGEKTFLEEKAAHEAELKRLSAVVVKTQEEEILQEVGVYEYRHPLSNSMTYKDRIDRLKSEIKEMAKANGGAIRATTDWTVNGSQAEGRRMVRDFSKLMLRAYNAEADNLVRGMKPYKLDAAIERLNRVTSTIERLGKTMSISVSRTYHRARIKELEMAADYQAKLAEEKEAARQEKERLREERKAQQEMERERKRLDKEHAHYTNALAQLEKSGDGEAIARLGEQLADISRAIEDVDYRAANVRAGYVYVISNIGSFGEHMVKIGMTRRLEPTDRIRELSDASVPFNFDVHALFFSDDAVGIERQMHERLADRRVNRVNQRREFFYATPTETRDLLKDLAGELLTFDETAEAVEYRQSQQELGIRLS